MCEVQNWLLLFIVGITFGIVGLFWGVIIGFRTSFLRL